MTATGAVIAGGYVNALGLVRSLAARGLRASVVTTKPFDIAHRSRFAADWDSAPEVEHHPAQLVEVLERRAREWRGRVVFPTNDATMAALAGAHDSLSRSYTLVAPPAEVAAGFIDKRLMRAAAERNGLDLPRHYGPATRDTADLEIEFPVVVKPVRTFPFSSVFGVKLFVANGRDDLRRCVERLERAGLEADVYERVPGGDECVYGVCSYVDGSGMPLGGLTVHKLRQGPPLYGDARVAEVVPDPPGLREATTELLRGMGHRGIATVEFKRDPRDGSFKFIEVNGRSFVYNGLVRRAGLDLAALAWADYTGERPAPLPARGWGGTWIHLHPDLLHAVASRRVAPLSLRDFIAPYRGRWIEAVWSARDPLPFAAQWAHPPSRRAANGSGGTTPP